jgi:hypothetical protein
MPSTVAAWAAGWRWLVCVVLSYEGDTRDHENRCRKLLEAVLAALTRAYLAYSPTEPRMVVPGRPLSHTLREIPFAPVLEPSCSLQAVGRLASTSAVPPESGGELLQTVL